MATFTVTSTADSGVGSLRAAIASASNGDIIQFDASLANSTITLTGGQLEVDKDLTIDGANAPNLTLSGNNTNRILHLGRDDDLTLKNLTLANGLSTGTDRGGAIHSEGRNVISIENTNFLNNTGGQGGALGFNSWSEITIKDSRFEGNTSTSTAGFSGGAISIFAFNNTTIQNTEFKNNTGVNGGAVYSLLSGLTVEDSRFLQNDSTPGRDTTNPNGFGGGIFVDGASDRLDPDVGTVLVRNTLFDGNRSAGRGAGVFFFLYDPDVAIIEDSTFINHEVIEHSNGNSEGGAIWHTDGELIVRNTTVANNRVLHRGGGLWAFETADVRIENSTFSGNVADDGAGGGIGGALRVSSTTEIVNSTIVNNHAGKQGGALFNIDRPVTATNTIFANNTVSNPDNPEQQTNVTVNDGGGNIQFPGVTPTGRDIQRIVAGALIADPLLGPLQDNGGGRFTHALLEGSPAIDAGQDVASLFADQRGILRNDGQIDIGAFEVEEIVPPEEPTNPPEEPTNPPEEPTNPPEEPTNPPEEPTNPPEEPTNPPEEPTNPTNPTNPTDPNTPTNPTNPTDPNTPTNPTNPTDPNTPTNPTNPTNPSNPTDPNNPTNPTNPTDPNTPTDPNNPTTPTNPTDPTPCINPGVFPPLRDSFTLCDDFVILGDEDDLSAALEGHDLAFGNGGNDWIFGNRGNDTLAGGDGNDSLYGGKDNDILYGNKLDDVLYGDIGADELYAGQGNDLLFGNTEGDILFADLGNDTAYGGRDNDRIYGNLNNDRLYGELGNDSIYGGRDEDTLDGGDGDDLLSGDLGNDSLRGGVGRDSFVVVEGGGTDAIADFESGEDVLALADGLTFDRLAISQGTTGAEVRVAETAEVLAVLEGVSADTVAAEDFVLL